MKNDNDPMWNRTKTRKTSAGYFLRWEGYATCANGNRCQVQRDRGNKFFTLLVCVVEKDAHFPGSFEIWEGVTGGSLEDMKRLIRSGIDKAAVVRIGKDVSNGTIRTSEQLRKRKAELNIG